MQAKSDENWRVGQRCLDDGDINAATSRLYYGVFQSVLAWARAKKGYNDTSRSVHSDMYRLVSSEGHQKVVFGRALQTLRSMREVADYQPDSPNGGKLSEMLTTCKRMKDHYQLKAKPE